MKLVKFKRLNDAAKMPTKAYESAGYDLFPIISGVIGPGQKANILLGFATSFDCDYVAVIDDRGGVGNKQVGHLAGIIDSDYRGEWQVIMQNFGLEPFEYSPAKAVAQVLFLRKESPGFFSVEELDSTDRGEGKFGSSDASR